MTSSTSAPTVGRPNFFPWIWPLLSPGIDPLPDDGSLELREDPAHLEHGFASRGRGVDPLLMEVQVNSKRVQFCQELKGILKGSSEAVY